MAVTGQAPTRNRYATASEGHRANTGVIPAHAQRKKTNAEIMAEAKRNQAIEREEQSLDRQDRISRGSRVRTPNIERPGVGNVTPIQGNRPSVPTQPIAIPSRRPNVGTPNAGTPNAGNPPASRTPRQPLEGPEVSVNPNLAGPDYQNMPIRRGSNNAGNTRGVLQRALGFAGQTAGSAVDSVLNLPRQAYHGIAKGIHNLNYAAGRAVFGQTGQTPEYGDYEQDRTFQTMGRNVGETFGHSADKLSAIPEAAAASVVDGGINLVGRGIHELNYGAGRTVFGQTGQTPEYQRVDPAMSVVGAVRGMPGNNYQERVANSDMPTYGALYGQKKGTEARVMPFMNSIARDEQAYQSAVREAQASARVTNAQKKKDKAGKKAAAEAERKKYWEDNNIKFQRRGGWLFQQGGQMPQEGSQEELVLDFAVRYLVTMGVPEEDIMDPQGNLNPEHQQELEQVLNSQEIAWSDYAASPDEYMQQFIGNLQAQTQMARKGAKLKRLSQFRIYRK